MNFRRNETYDYHHKDKPLCWYILTQGRLY